MERMVAAIVNDPQEVGGLIAAHRSLFQLTHGITRGGWGLGYHQHGEMLVRRQPLRGPVDTSAMIAKAQRPHLVAWAGPPSRRPFRLDQILPARYRNWLFASTGGSELGDDFVARVTEHVRGFTAHGRTLSGVPEAVMLVFMKALQSVGELDRRGFATLGVTEGIRCGAQALRGLLGAAWERLSLAVLLHVKGLTFGLALGRPLYRIAFEGLEVARPDRVLRRGPVAHLRATVLTDGAAAAGHAEVERWTGVVVGEGARPVTFGLA